MREPVAGKEPDASEKNGIPGDGRPSVRSLVKGIPSRS
jgi:hypothetical protein